MNLLSVNAHDLVGGMVMGHFAWRAWLLATTGSSGLDGSSASAACIAIHALLHLTALRFGRRRCGNNAVWPEMRWHTAIFAARSITTLAAMWLASEHGSAQPFAEAVAGTRKALQAFAPEMASSPAARAAAWAASALDRSLPDPPVVLAVLPVVRIVSVMMTMLLVDAVSAAFGRAGANRTGAYGNPFPAGTPELVSRAVNCFYELSQIAGTLIILCSADMAPVLFVMLPIQTVPLLMTLVRRGLLRQGGWHSWCILSIIVAYAVCAVAGAQPGYEARMTWAQAGSIVLLCGAVRAVLGISKYAMWSVLAAAIYWRPQA